MKPEIVLFGDSIFDNAAYTKRGEAVIQHVFRREYRKMLEKARSTGLPVTVCTIYDNSPMMEVWHRAALTVFNDVITNEAAVQGASLIDLRAVCDDPGDYSSVSPIEPSEQGSVKIARVIKLVLDDQLGGATGSRIYL